MRAWDMWKDIEQYIELTKLDGDMPEIMIPSRAFIRKAGPYDSYTCMEIPWLKENPAPYKVFRALALYDEDSKMFVNYRIDGDTIVCDKKKEHLQLDYLSWEGETRFTRDARVSFTLHGPEIFKHLLPCEIRREDMYIDRSKIFTTVFVRVVIASIVIILIVLNCIKLLGDC